MQPLSGAAARGQWLALTAALLGWLFDGFEMGLIAAAANVGYALVALLSLGLSSLRSSLSGMGLPESWVEWRLLMVCGAVPALLTFFVRLFVPESERWRREKERGATSSWAGRDLLAVLCGVAVCAGLLAVWQKVEGLPARIVLTLLALALVAGCYL